MTGVWLLEIRDAAGQVVEACEDYTAAEFTARWNQLGTWTLTVPLTSSAAALLSRPGYGIVASLDGVARFSGYVLSFGADTGDGTANAVFAGADDLIVLADRLASPEPGTAAPPYAGSAYDTRSGVCETVVKAYVAVNAGSGAVPARRWAGLSIAPDLARGATVTGNTRWHRLLDVCAELALTGGLGLSCVNLVFDVVVPTDRTTLVEFSAARGSLGRVQFAQEAPGATYVVVGGGGEGTARLFVEHANLDALGVGWWRAERFRDARDTSDTVVLAQRATEELHPDIDDTKLGLTVDAIDTPGVRWPTDYQLGDLVTVETPFATTVTRRVAELKISLTAEQGTTVTPTLGVLRPEADAVAAAVAALQAQARRITRLEVR